MKAVVFRGVGDIRIEDAPEPKIETFDRHAPGSIKVEQAPAKAAE
jgi:hypothetical protein